MGIRHPYWARRRIRQLNADTDFTELNHLAFEVRYASPIFTHALFTLAFARQAAVPSIAKVLYQGGSGASVTATRKRNNDTLLFFGEFYRHGNSPQGQAIAAQLNRIHSRFNITNEQNLFTLATLMCEPLRMSRFLTGRVIFSAQEVRALYLFWKMVAGMLHIHSIPQNETAMMQYYLNYARQNFEYSHEGHAVVNALADEFAQRWYPPAMRHMGRQVYFSLFDTHMLQTFNIPAPAAFYRVPVRAHLWLFLRVWAPIMPDPANRSIIDFFSKDYGHYHITNAGAQ